MEAKWLEDFVCLAETGSFSRAALLRHVTQPAFSRRIQSLENWIGVDLIDRTSYPTRLTPAGQVFYEQALNLLAQMGTTRALLRGSGKASAQTLQLAVPHTLSFVFVPKWVKRVEKKIQSQFPGPLRTRLIAGNVHDAVLTLAESNCDLVICYYHPRIPLQLDPQRYEFKSIGSETVSPYCRPRADGKPLYQLPGKDVAPIPWLNYTANAYLARVVEQIQTEARARLNAEIVYETDMAEGLKMMALEGHGLAWLPDSLVAKETRARRLIMASDQWRVSLEIRVYRQRQIAERQAKPIAAAVWNAL